MADLPHQHQHQPGSLKKEIEFHNLLTVSLICSADIPELLNTRLLLVQDSSSLSLELSSVSRKFPPGSCLMRGSSSSLLSASPQVQSLAVLAGLSSPR